MITYPKTRMDKRWDIMPESLREVLYSPAYGETVLRIAENHHLDEIKREAVVRLTAFVIYGFVHPEELDDKIMEELDVDRTTAKEVTEEIDKKIFEEFRKEISGMYSPVSETAAQVESIQKPAKEGDRIGHMEITEEEPEEKEEKKIRRYGVLTPEEPRAAGEEKKKEMPFVIHEEKGSGKKKEGEARKSFRLGSFFGKDEKKERPSAKIQVPGKKKPSSAKASEDKKTVHYSEYRTAMDSGGEKDFINIPDSRKKDKGFEMDRIGKDVSIKSKPEKQVPEKKSETRKPKPGKGEEDSGPAVEGNTIDLRNL